LLGYQTHDKAINEIAPLYYSRIRIHRGIVTPIKNEFNISQTTSIRFNKIDMNIANSLANITSNRIVIKWDEHKINNNITTNNSIDNYNSYLDSLVDIEGGSTGLVPPSGYILNQPTSDVFFDFDLHINLTNTNIDNINNNSVNIFNILSNKGHVMINNEIERLDSLFTVINNYETTYEVLSCVTLNSRFLRDLSLDIKLIQFINLSSGLSLIPHPMVYNHGTIYKFAEEININNFNILLNKILNNNISDKLMVIFLNSVDNSDNNASSDINKEILEGSGFIFNQNNIINIQTKCRDILILKYVDSNLINNNLYILPNIDDNDSVIPNGIKMSGLIRYHCWNLQKILINSIRLLNCDYSDLTKELIMHRVCILESCQRLCRIIKTLPYINNKKLIIEELLYSIKGESTLEIIASNRTTSDLMKERDLEQYNDYLKIIQELISQL
jgi:hypothetical protein